MDNVKKKDKGKQKPHLVKDLLSKEWTAIHTPLKGFGESPKAALDDLESLKKDVSQDPFGF